MKTRGIGIWLFGLLGAAILVALGTWQIQRLGEKQLILAEIERSILAQPTTLPLAFDPPEQRYMPIEVAGQFGANTTRVLVSQKIFGAGYRLITDFVTDDGRRILVDRGFLKVADAVPPPPDGAVALTGNLHWPDEIDGWTPAPDLEAGIWFARDVPALADAMGTEPGLLVLKATSQPEPSVTPLPVDTSGIPNNHLNYAITWFALAVVWLGMTAFFLYRRRRESTVKG